MMTSYRLQLVSLSVLVICLYSVNCATTFNCLRNGQTCLNGGNCIAGGTCDCDPIYQGFNCDIEKANINPDAEACGCLNNGVCMLDTSCKCDESFYGPLCEYDRDVILCFGDRKIIYINPVGFTGGTVFISGNRQGCPFIQAKDATDTADFLPEWAPGAAGEDGYVITINDVDETCGNIVETTSEDLTETIYTRQANVEFDVRIVTSFDEIYDAICTKTVNDDREFQGVLIRNQLTDQQLQRNQAQNNFEPLKFEAQLADATYANELVLVGLDIKLVFFIPPDSGYVTVTLTSLNAEAPEAESTRINLVTDRCPQTVSSSIVKSIEKSVDLRTVTVVIQVFKFVNYDHITFTGTARICKDGDNQCDARNDCPFKLPSESSAAEAGAEVAPEAPGRRKRESGSEDLKIEQTFRVTSDPNEVAPQTSQTQREEDCPKSNTEEVHCLQKTEIITVIALLAASVVILLIACIVLTWRLLRGAPKTAEVHPFQYETQSSRSLPRLAPTNF